ncbi:acyl-CoA dehydrogenase family protein [Roseovarius sp.]|uniref:acyl-CoA dehydrogenase family protein n=1 Tax=Roseovarius sp. TaxID=1486281 RepID=UPI00356B11E1
MRGLGRYCVADLAWVTDSCGHTRTAIETGAVLPAPLCLPARAGPGRRGRRFERVRLRPLASSEPREGSPIDAEWRDSRLHRIGGGSDEVQRQVIARMMGL